MSKKKKIAVVMLTALLSVLLCMPASAATTVKMLYEKPLADDKSGYMEVWMEDANGSSVVYTYYYRIIGDTVGIDANARALVTITSDSIYVKFPTFDLSGVEELVPLTVACGFMRSNDNYHATYYEPIFSGQGWYEWKPSSYKIHGAKAYGFLSPDDSSETWFSAGEWTVTYGADTTISNQLDTLISVIQSQNNNDIIANADKNASNIQSNADKNASNIQSNADKNADEIQSNQDANTDKLIQAQKDQVESEKQEANTTGDGNVGSLTDAIPTETDGLLSAFGSLINSMLHTGTDINLSFPAIKTPEIAGIVPAFTLTEEKAINFQDIEEVIPKSILDLVRALFTIALILYCFKELYGTISYVLTLKGGASE